MFRTVLVLAMVVGATSTGLGLADEPFPLPHAVVLNNNGRVPPTPNVYPLFRLSERFGLVENFYTPAGFGVSFREDLERSALLYIGQYSDESPLFRDPGICEAIRGHLKGGGMVVFDYHTGARDDRFHPETIEFLKSIGVEPPGDFHTGYGSSRFEEADAHVLLSRPAAIGGRTLGHWGWWQKWSADQTVLARDRNAPSQATLILQDGVLGEGTVLFSQLPSPFREPAGLPFDLVRNIIAYTYDGRSDSP